MSTGDYATTTTMVSHYWAHGIAVVDSLPKYLSIKALMGELIIVYSFFFTLAEWQLVLALLFLITFDMITGVGASRKKGIPIESRRLVKTAVKMGIYGIMISTMHMTDVAVGIPENWLNLEMGMIAFLTATEAVSILENIGNMGYATPRRILGVIEQFQETEPDVA